MHSILLTLCLCGIMLGNSLGGTPPNYALIESLMQENPEQKKKVAEWVFEKAALSAASQDSSLLRHVMPSFYANRRNEPIISMGRCAPDAVERDYGEHWGAKTIQTQRYWLFMIDRSKLHESPRSFTTKMIHLPGVKWRFEAQWKCYRVYHCTLPKFPVGLPFSPENQKYERSFWARSVRVFENPSHVLVCVEKLYSNRPVMYYDDLESNLQWFQDIRNAKDKLGRPIYPRWWEFWRWRIFR